MPSEVSLRDIFIDIALSSLTIAGSYFIARAIIDGGITSLFKKSSNVQGKKLVLDEHEAALVECVVDRSKLHTKLCDVGGLNTVCLTLRETIVWPFNMPELYPPSLRKPAMGVLLHGPPGTGKTMIARALAAECNASFMEVKVESLFAKWVGETERNASAVFSLARKLAPVILFIDEIDSLLGSRELSDHSAEQNAKAIFLREWDGLASAAAAGDGCRIIVVGATNMPQNLDRAIMRRMPLKFEIPLPTPEARDVIFRLHLAKAAAVDALPGEEAPGGADDDDGACDPPHVAVNAGNAALGLDPSLSVSELVSVTEGLSGAQIEQVVREARMGAARGAARDAIDELVRMSGPSGPSKAMVSAVAPRGVRPLTMDDFVQSLALITPTWQGGPAGRRGRFTA